MAEKLTPQQIQRIQYEHQERQKCAKKNRYNDKASALARAAADAEKPRYKRSSEVASVYKCPWCPFWHISMQRPR